jgi:hypothetical protein
VLINVTISGNSAIRDGGGIANTGSSPVLTNVTISGNAAGAGVGAGGGIYNETNSDPEIRNSIIWENTSSTNIGIHNDDPVNSIPVISYSNVQGENPGGTNLDGTLSSSNPLFVNLVPATTALPTIAGNYRLQTSSPAIDVGSDALYPDDWTTKWYGDTTINSSLRTVTPGFQDIYTARILPALAYDITGTTPRIKNGGTSLTIDMGAYEN